MDRRERGIYRSFWCNGLSCRTPASQAGAQTGHKEERKNSGLNMIPESGQGARLGAETQVFEDDGHTGSQAEFPKLPPVNPKTLNLLHILSANPGEETFDRPVLQLFRQVGVTAAQWTERETRMV
jgi:hypothetical protein